MLGIWRINLPWHLSFQQGGKNNLNGLITVINFDTGSFLEASVTVNGLCNAPSLQENPQIVSFQ